MRTKRSGGDQESRARIRAALELVESALRAKDAAEIAQLRILATLGREALSMSDQNGLLGRETDMHLRAVAAELAAIARCGDRRIQNEIGRALEIVDGNPLVLAAWEAGRLTARHVDDIVKLGRNIPGENQEEWQEAAIAVAERDVPVRVHGALEALAQHFTARTFAERHKAAVADRGVYLRDLGDGMSELTLRVRRRCCSRSMTVSTRWRRSRSTPRRKPPRSLARRVRSTSPTPAPANRSERMSSATSV